MLSIEVGQQWEAQITLWTDAIAQTCQHNRELAVVTSSVERGGLMPIFIEDRGKAMEHNESPLTGISEMWDVTLEEDLAKVYRE